VSESNYRPEFQKQIKKFLETVYSSVSPKTLHGAKLNGFSESHVLLPAQLFLLLWLTFCNPFVVLVELAKNYVDAINKGAIPTIESAWGNLVSVQAEAALSSARTEISKR
jgi:hypothetical protein